MAYPIASEESASAQGASSPYDMRFVEAWLKDPSGGCRTLIQLRNKRRGIAALFIMGTKRRMFDFENSCRGGGTCFPIFWHHSAKHQLYTDFIAESYYSWKLQSCFSFLTPIKKIRTPKSKIMALNHIWPFFIVDPWDYPNAFWNRIQRPRGLVNCATVQGTTGAAPRDGCSANGYRKTYGCHSRNRKVYTIPLETNISLPKGTFDDVPFPYGGIS